MFKAQKVLILLAINMATMQEIKAQSSHFCGRHLSDTLELICNGNFNTAKRKSGNRLINHLTKRTSYIGIVDECCFRPCSLQTLSTYCAEPPKDIFDIQTTTRQPKLTDKIMVMMNDVPVNVPEKDPDENPDDLTYVTTTQPAEQNSWKSYKSKNRFRNVPWFFVRDFGQDRPLP